MFRGFLYAINVFSITHLKQNIACEVKKHSAMTRKMYWYIIKDFHASNNRY